MPSCEPKYIYVKSLKEFNAKGISGFVFHREVLDNKGNPTGWVEIKLVQNYTFPDGETVIEKIRKLKGGWYENKKTI